MKKILFFHFDLGHGGAEKVLVNLINSLDKDKYDITLKTLFHHGVNSTALDKNIKWEWVFDCKPFRGIVYLLKIFSPEFLHKRFIKNHYDIEIAYLEGPSTRIISGCKNSTTKIYTWIHTSFKDNNIIFRTYRSKHEFFSCYSKFDKIAAVSKTAKAEFQNLCGNQGMVTVVNNVLDIDAICQMAEEDININLNDGMINFCSVGRLIKVKGYERLIDIVDILVNKEKFTSFHLYILGEGEQKEKLLHQIVVLGLSDYVTLLGFNANPYKYVSKMDFFICSSYREGYSTAVTESVIVKTPVITTRCSGMEEILGEEDAGIIVDNSTNALLDGMRTIIKDVCLRETLKRGVIERSKFFTKERTIKQFEDFIANV